jgi:hypothetical protein
VGNSFAHIFLNSVLNQLRSHSTAMSPIRLGSRILFPGSLSRVLTLQLQAPRAGLAQLQQRHPRLSFQRFESHQRLCTLANSQNSYLFKDSSQQRLRTFANSQDSYLFKDSNRIKDFVHLPITRTALFSKIRIASKTLYTCQFPGHLSSSSQCLHVSSFITENNIVHFTTLSYVLCKVLQHNHTYCYTSPCCPINTQNLSESTSQTISIKYSTLRLSLASLISNLHITTTDMGWICCCCGTRNSGTGRAQCIDCDHYPCWACGHFYKTRYLNVSDVWNSEGRRWQESGKKG